ncbi:riboflavin synthase [Robiginitalea marina]|uniref:Riboflavin synthase n=1 Tax=Robiginitalea marina TaxID=2954105 RepID=A0ABT1B1U0_9FLAO|nr:riboflavin synthase [Robiginitalea marina]MCO5725805.1 riboflavin synthase [Robiginitalea marina]
MFTGIIETLAEVARLETEGGNLHLTLRSPLARELKIDQSLAHNGVCLTVVDIAEDTYTVTAIAETLSRTNLGDLGPGSLVNLERAMVLGARLDGHLVQGHVDQVAHCTRVEAHDGSWVFHFAYTAGPGQVTIEKGSITVDGVSLTVVDSGPGTFSVAIIPYTYEHTRFSQYREGSRVNLEFDVIGKYVARLLEGYTR